jgi:pentose-5-phosphate-3-epimerase
VVERWAGEVKIMSGNPNFNRQTFIDACLADDDGVAK